MAESLARYIKRMYADLLSLAAHLALLEDRRWELGVRVRVGVMAHDRHRGPLHLPTQANIPGQPRLPAQRIHRMHDLPRNPPHLHILEAYPIVKTKKSDN